MTKTIFTNNDPFENNWGINKEDNIIGVMFLDKIEENEEDANYIFLNNNQIIFILRKEVVDRLDIENRKIYLR